MYDIQQIINIFNEIIRDEELIVDVNDEIIFINNNDFEIETDIESFFYVNNKILNYTKLTKFDEKFNIKDSFIYILVQMNNKYGFDKYLDLNIKLRDINIRDFEHIKRIVKEQNNEENNYDIFAKILYSIGRPEDISKKYNIHYKLIKHIKSLNRKVILNKILEGNK